MFFDTNNKVYILEYPTASKEDLSHTGKNIVKMAATQFLNIKECDLNFEKGDYGKPYLKGFPNFHFNISHSGNFLAVAFGSKPVGVDIETVKDINLKIADRRFADEEKAFVKDNKTFLTVWTRKEAYAKQFGSCLPRFLSSFNSLSADNIKTFEFDDYILSVCSENVLEFKILNLKDISIKDFIT